MYYIYVDNQPLYVPDLANDGFTVFDPIITEELNKSGSLEFTIPPTNEKYNDLHHLKSIVTVYENNVEIWRGRVLNTTRDFYNNKKVYCEGELSFLLDSVQRNYHFEGKVSDLFKKFINSHNAEVEARKEFNVGQITIDDASETIDYKSSANQNTMEEIRSKLLDNHGGYLRTRFANGKRYIDYIEDYTGTSNQVIRLGENLLDVEIIVNSEDLFTVLIPYGKMLNDKTGKRLTISSVNGGKDYIQSDAGVSNYGKIWKVKIWNGVKDASKLKVKAQKFLNRNIKSAVTLTIKAIDLHLLDVDTDRIEVGQYIKVESEPHGINDNFQCSKIVLNMSNPDKSEFTFGLSRKSLTEKNVTVQSNMSAEVENNTSDIQIVSDDSSESMIDISDGLSSELFHICKLSGVG